MLIRKPDQTQARQMDMPGASGVTMRLMVGRDDGDPNFAMRLFEVEPGGHTPHHSHNYEHEIVILQGEADVACGPEGQETRQAGVGDVLYIPANQPHQFHNTADTPLKFMCLVPTQFDCGGTCEPTPGSY
jgi:quercetin dioxygenase-like cupin family protein